MRSTCPEHSDYPPGSTPSSHSPAWVLENITGSRRAKSQDRKPARLALRKSQVFQANFEDLEPPITRVSPELHLNEVICKGFTSRCRM